MADKSILLEIIRIQQMELDALREQATRYQELVDKFVAWIAAPKPASVDAAAIQAAADHFRASNDSFQAALASLTPPATVA